MSITCKIIEFLDSQNNATYPTLPTEKNGSGFYGDIITRWIKDRQLNKAEVANNMNLNPRVLDYVLSKNDKHYRHIGFYEVLRLAVVLNLSLAEALELLRVCNFGINRESFRDRIIVVILSVAHLGVSGMEERLACLQALEDNEPFNTNDYNYQSLFNYLYKFYN